MKSDFWKHEEEIRLIYKDKDMTYITSQYADLRLPYLTHIYLGTNVSEKNRRYILSLAKQVGVNITEMVPDQHEFKLNSVPIPPVNDE